MFPPETVRRFPGVDVPMPTFALSIFISSVAWSSNSILAVELLSPIQLSSAISRSPVKVAVAALRVNWSDAKAIVGSVAPASNVQVKPDPAPKVSSVISVPSRVKVKVSAERAISIPSSPSSASERRLRVSPWIIEDVPVSPAVEKREPPDTKQVEQDISPSAEMAIGEDADTATVPDALGKVIVLSLTVGSVKAM